MSNQVLYGTIPLPTGNANWASWTHLDTTGMPTKPTDNLNSSETQAYLEAWLADMMPALVTRWSEQVSKSPARQPISNLDDWIALLNTAATAPWQIADRLAQLLAAPKSSTDLENSWAGLTGLFSLTFEAAQDTAGQLGPSDWQNLLEVQNRILKQAARVLQVRRKRPDTAVLSRRALYLQTITDLDQKIVEIWDPAELLDEVVTVIQNNLGYEYVNLFLLTPTGQTLSLKSAIWKNQRPKPKDHIDLPVGEAGAVSRAAATGQIVVAGHAPDNANFSPHPALPHIKSQMAVPLIAGKTLIGVLDIACERPNAFAEDDLQIGQALAYHVAVAIENARLQTDLQRRLREQTLLYESNLALGTSLDMDRVLGLMTKKIAEALEAGACVICQIDEQARTTTALAEYIFRYPGNPTATWRKLNKPVRLSKDPAAQQVLRTGRPVIGRLSPEKTGRHSGWTRSLSQGDTDTGRKQKWGVLLAFPLAVNEKITGLVEIYDKNPNRNFSTDDIQLCRILATQTSLAMERARLYHETRQRLNEVATLYTMAQELAGKLDLQAVLDNIVVTLRQAVGCRASCIFLLDHTGQQLEIKAADGLKSRWREAAKLRLGEGVAGLAAAEKRTVYVPDTYKEPSFIFFDEEVRSLIAIPLSAHGEVIGAINLDDNRPNAFGPTQERLLTIAATQAGIIIDNARLFAKVSREQQQTRAIIQHMADGLLLINSRGVIITCNQTLAIMLGLHTGQIIGQHITSSDLHPNLAAITSGAGQPARTGVLAREVTIDTPRPKTLQVFTTTVVDDTHRPTGEVRVVHDITKEKELEQLKDEFFATVSHELRTPLFSIQGFAQLLQDQPDLDAETRAEFLATIQRQAGRLGDMVNNLLDLSKFDQGRLELETEPVMMVDLIHQTILKLQGFAHQQKVKLVSKLPPMLPTITGDKQRLEQVLTNLIGNAIKFSNAGDEVLIFAQKTDNRLQVSVKDSGIGIPAEALEHIFSRYYRAEHKNDRVVSGSGLGLYISKKIVEEHGGRIWVESAEGQGSTFYFSLPLAKSNPS